MLRSLDGLAVRQMKTRRLRAALTSLGVVLGVGMVFGVLTLVGTIHKTFGDLIDSAWGKTDLIVTAGPGGALPTDTPDRIRVVADVAHVGPMVGGMFTRLDSHGRAIKGGTGMMMVAGFDPQRSPYDFKLVQGRFQRSGPDLVIERNWARDRGYHVGDWIAVGTTTGRARLHVVGIFELNNNLSFGGRGFAGMAVPEARLLMDRPTGWDQISITATRRDAVPDLRRRLERRLGDGVALKSPQEFGDEANSQIQALNVVLYFFSGVALFVGGFLILNSFNMTVLQRMRELGTLRTLGASPRMIMRTVLAEALVIGVIGTIVGLGVGLGLAKGLIAAMQGLGLPVGQLSVGFGYAIVAAVLGIVVTLAGALWPARRAGRVSPIRAVLGATELRLRPRRRRLVFALALFLPGLLFGGKFWMGGGNTGSTLTAVLGIGATMGMFAGIAMASPFMIPPVLRALAVPLRRISPTAGRLATDSVSTNPMRTAATAAALTIGLSVFVVNSVFTSSFLGTIREQVDRNYASDFTVQAVGGGLDTGESYPIDLSLQRRLAALPGAADVVPVSARFVKLPGTKTKAANGIVIAYDPAQYGKVDRTEVAGSPSREAALAGVARGGVLVEPEYRKLAKLHVGDKLTLSGPAGTHAARVVGELRAMGAFGGMSLQMSQQTAESVYGAMNPIQMRIRARSPGDVAGLERRSQRILDRSFPNLEIQSTAETKKAIDTEIKQQFGLFNAIIAVAVLVSLLGVINTLAMSVLERTREIGVLRALGSSRWLVRGSLLDESLLITAAGALVGIVSGLIIGVAWLSGLGDVMPGLSFRFPIGATVLVAFVAVVLGTLAAILPARRAARVDVIRALTYE